MNRDTSTALGRSLDQAGCSYTNLFHKGVWITNRHKIDMTVDYLRRDGSDFVIGADATDVLIVSEISDLIEKFEAMKCDIIFNAEVRFWPRRHMEVYRRHEEGLAGVGPFKYLNAGLWMGRRKQSLEFFSTCQKLRDWSLHPFSEQACVKRTHAEWGGKSIIDENCVLFQNLNSVPRAWLELIRSEA